MKVNDLKLWLPATAWSCPWVLWCAGSCGLLLYAAFRVLWPTVGSPAETAMALLGLVSLLVWGGGLKKSVALWLLLAAIGVQILSWTLGYFHHPQWVADNPQIDRLAKLFIFIAVAWWLGGSTRNTLLVWLLGLMGFLIATFTHGGGLQEWINGLNGQRTGFGIRNNQHGPMLYGVALLGVLVFGKRFAFSSRIILWRLLLWLALVVLCLTGVLIGQTRAVWLALAVTLPFCVLLWALWAGRRSGVKRLFKPAIAGVVGITLATLLIGSVYQDVLFKRLGAEQQVITEVLHGDLENVPYSSVGIRIHSWVAAVDWIKERPMVGWGAEGRSLVIDHTEWLPERIKKDFGHLHNFFLEIWVAYGILGLVVIGALATWVGRATWLAWRGGVLPGDMALFGAVFFVYWVIVNQFESYNSFWTGVYVHNLVLGGLVTHYWRWTLEGSPKV